MKRIVIITVVIAASFVFVPVSVFAAEDHNSFRSNLSNIIAPATIPAKCKNAGGVWAVDVHGKGICKRGASKESTGKSEIDTRGLLGPFNK